MGFNSIPAITTKLNSFPVHGASFFAQVTELFLILGGVN
jgi:hypothetical protein